MFLLLGKLPFGWAVYCLHIAQEYSINLKDSYISPKYPSNIKNTQKEAWVVNLYVEAVIW